MKSARLYIFLCLLLPGFLAAQDHPPKLVPALGWDRAVQGGFPTCVIADAQNAIWVGTEGNGLWRYDAREKKWRQFTAKDDGLGDDCIYALAVDKLGRVWAGHLNHGVSVWNGEKWKNYDILDGPLGSRVFAITTCPTDGDVWIATDCGAARYSLAKDDWDYFTRASGLPSDQIQTIAFDSKGGIYLGTQCDGIVMADAADNYKKWDTASGPLQMPNAATGIGLATSMINQISVVIPPKTLTQSGETDRVITATPLGISASTDNGQQFNFIRGEDWQMNVGGLFDAPPAAPQQAMGGLPLFIRGGGAVVINGNVNIGMAQRNLPMEDWVTCTRQEKETGYLWTGFRQKGLEIRNFGITPSVRIDTEGLDSLLVRSIWIGPKAPPLIAVYDEAKGGLDTLDTSTASLGPGAQPPKTPPPLPAPAKAPDDDSMAPLANQIDKFKNDLEPGDAVYLGDDWRTGGDWAGRYGSSYAMLCGFGQAGIYAGAPGYDARVELGPHHRETSVITIASDHPSDDPRVLYNPSLGHRIAGEVNDGSLSHDVYPQEWEGPDLWVTVGVPEGIHVLSLYFVNDNAHEGGTNKLRDYDVQVLAPERTPELTLKGGPLARARVTDFRGGVYKQFVLTGPSHYVVRIGRNRSFSTRLQGLFIDRVDEDDTAVKKPLPGFEKVKYMPPEITDGLLNGASPIVATAAALWAGLDGDFSKSGLVALQYPLRIWAWRAAVINKAPDTLLANWRWQLDIWTPEDRDAFQKAMAAAYKHYTDKNPPAKKDEKPSN